MTKARKIVLLGLSIITLALISSVCFGNQFNKDSVGKEVSIGWEEVNVRENHSTSSEILDVLYYGNTIHLTGNSFEALGNGYSYDSWTEIQLSDGTIGWVVTPSIKWWY